MNNRKVWIALIALSSIFFCHQTHAIGGYAVKDTLHVMTLAGLKLRTSAGLSAGVKALLPYGSSIIVKKLTTKTDSVTEVDGYGIRGDWVEVITEQGEGFVFDGYLTSFIPPKITKNETQGQHLEAYIQESYKPLSEKMRASKHPGEYNQAFSQGIRLAKRIAPDSSNYGRVMIREISLEEAYLIANVICRTMSGSEDVDYLADGVLNVKRKGEQLMLSPTSGTGLELLIVRHEEKGGGGGATIQYREVFAKAPE